MSAFGELSYPPERQKVALERCPPQGFGAAAREWVRIEKLRRAETVAATAVAH
jgi:hypothetical protein